ncbi:DMT family transporter [uncultured Bacteroides sp.]|uniref:DMT family transporter n=1 Tax=uncultured Bacteroides sp. TaxID=162156 RepID=UPI00262E3B55|nr:DMT family transporter [uncultured Bacteroides sp.]
MKEAFWKLHLSVLLAGGTGVFGRLITLNEGLLVWYRMLLATILFYFVLLALKKLRRVSFRDALRISGVGMLLAIHWIFFYGSIKASNVSIGVVCLSLMSIFTVLFEYLIHRHRTSVKEILCSLIGVLGIVLIFHFDTRYRLGIFLGVISSAMASLFTITNKKVGVDFPASTMLLYEMAGGFVGLSCILPFYLWVFPVSTIIPSVSDFIYLLIFVTVCTVWLYILQIQVLKKVSAFTLNLTYNLEPIYSIILAMIIFHEAKDLNFSFYTGLGLIILSVVLQTLNVLRTSRIAKK